MRTIVLKFDVDDEVYLSSEKDIKATITGIRIDPGDHIAYRCSWFSGREHKVDFFEASELYHVKPSDGLQIGFKRQT